MLEVLCRLLLLLSISGVDGKFVVLLLRKVPKVKTKRSCRE